MSYGPYPQLTSDGAIYLVCLFVGVLTPFGSHKSQDFAELGLVTFVYYTPLICGVGGDLMVLFELVVFVVVVV